ncbi:unnamed protein product [Acanthoscelides obtectus]|uniref:THAP-type domain-containing protein n=1 Tax=Acanthoscelides obtectus TaxID=200917 RepID=A0A9P0PZ03_ACAOB|nr:unnamed protein product [Acanthoscelides obtectus]CAK1624268.1 hypothetical protein AOBTE_LOCUS2457 [Acanthoscelides obtectus]
MERQCCVCKLRSLQPEAKGLSFHRIPAEPTRRSIWVSLLGFEKDHELPKCAAICWKHFRQSNFVIMGDEVRRLRSNAAPIPVHSAF